MSYVFCCTSVPATLAIVLTLHYSQWKLEEKGCEGYTLLSLMLHTRERTLATFFLPVFRKQTCPTLFFFPCVTYNHVTCYLIGLDCYMLDLLNSCITWRNISVSYWHNMSGQESCLQMCWAHLEAAGTSHKKVFQMKTKNQPNEIRTTQYVHTIPSH